MHEFQEKVQREKEKELEEKINEFETSSSEKVTQLQVCYYFY